ncbi:hypothetical protein ACFL34_03365 [Candidatus Sumerlaeota bacterium]
MSFKSCIGFGIAGAIISAYLVWPLIVDSLTIDAPWWVRLVAFTIFSSPIWLSLIVIPIWVAGFMAATDRAEDFIVREILRNRRK